MAQVFDGNRLTRLNILQILRPEYSVLCEAVKWTLQLKGTPDAGSYHLLAMAKSWMPFEHMNQSGLSNSSSKVPE